MVIVECNPDEYLVRQVLGEVSETIKHGGGKGNVLRKLRDEQRAVGVIDEDPGSSQPRDMKNYDERDSLETIKVMKRADDEAKTLIQLSPDIEGWLIRRAQENGISLMDYSLPDNRKEMHDIHHIEKNESFQRLVSKLIEIGDAEISALRNWITQAKVEEESEGYKTL